MVLSQIMYNEKEESIMRACVRIASVADERIDEKYWDDISGKELNPELVKKARREEMEEVYKHEIYVKVPISQCLERTGKNPVKVRWVDVRFVPLA